MTTYEITIQPEILVTIFTFLGAAVGFVIGKFMERNGRMKAPIGTLVVDRNNGNPDLYLQLTADIESFEREREVRLNVVSAKNRQKRSRR